MLYWANLGCLATKVIISAQESTKEMAAKCLFSWHGSSKLVSGTQSMIQTKIISSPSSQFSGVKMYLLRDTLIWKASLKANMIKRTVNTVHKAAVPSVRMITIMAMMAQSSQEVMKMNLRKSVKDWQPCRMSLLQSLSISNP